MKVVIVGGVAGGATAAARIRRLDEQAEIVVFERSGYISYANCGLPYYIGGVIEDAGELTLQTPESFFARFRVQMKVLHEVTAIHPDRKTVSVTNLQTGEYFEESYDKLLLSPGAKPTQPRFPGADSDRLFTLRTVEDTLRIRAYIDEHHPRSAVLAGGGFIGLELAENLRELGMDVTIVQKPMHLMTPFDADMAALIHGEMRQHGVKLALGHTVEGFAQRDGGMDVLLQDAAPLHADMVILAIGVTPDTGLAKDAGLELGVRGSIVVNDRMETSVPDIYAVGDAVQVRHFVTGQDALIALAGPANKQGRIAADNICGGDSRYTGSQGSSVLKVFDMTAALTGLNETQAAAAGLDADAAAFKKLGMRSRIATMFADKGFFDTLPLKEGELPRELLPKGGGKPQSIDEYIAEVETAYLKYRGDPLVGIILGTDGPQRCSDELLLRHAELERKYKMGWETHILEAKTQAIVSRSCLSSSSRRSRSKPVRRARRMSRIACACLSDSAKRSMS